MTPRLYCESLSAHRADSRNFCSASAYRPSAYATFPASCAGVPGALSCVPCARVSGDATSMSSRNRVVDFMITPPWIKKSPLARALFLLDLRFLVHHVLTHDRVELLHFELFRLRPLVLVGRVEMTGTGRRHHLDLVAHRCSLNLLAARTQVGDDLVDTDLVNHAHAGRRDLQTHEALFGFHPETLIVQVRQEPATRLVVRV